MTRNEGGNKWQRISGCPEWGARSGLEQTLSRKTLHRRWGYYIPRL